LAEKALDFTASLGIFIDFYSLERGALVPRSSFVWCWVHPYFQDDRLKESLMMKHKLTAAAFAAILASPIFAQNSTPSPSAAAQERFVRNQHATDWRGSKLIGAIVYGPDNASIGSINDVVIGNDGQVRAVVIGVGGFLGVNEKNVGLPLDALNITRKPDSNAIDKISVSTTKDDLKNAPQFAYDDGNSGQTTGSSVSGTIKSLDSTNLNPTDDQKK
jgi:hypothetical protein